MTADDKTLDTYRNALKQYVELEERAKKFANRISKALYKLSFNIDYIELQDEDSVYISGTIFWGGSEEYEHYIIPLGWFILPEEELTPAIDNWIKDYKKAQKQKEEEERKKRAEAKKQEELAELKRLQTKYSNTI